MITFTKDGRPVFMQKKLSELLPFPCIVSEDIVSEKGRDNYFTYISVPKDLPPSDIVKISQALLQITGLIPISHSRRYSRFAIPAPIKDIENLDFSALGKIQFEYKGSTPGLGGR